MITQCTGSGIGPGTAQQADRNRQPADDHGNQQAQSATLSPKMKQDRHKTLTEENVHVGLMFGSKALVQLLTNPWIGPLTNK